MQKIGELSLLPPTYVQIGENVILLDDSKYYILHY